MTGSSEGSAEARGRELVALFHPDLASFGSLAALSAERLPPGPRRLLDHQHHMTVAMERFHGGPVSLRVIHRCDNPAGLYAREILLSTEDGRVVQHGIVRIDLSRLAPETAAAIRSEAAPLGRILLEASLLCDVHNVATLEVAPGPQLQSLFGTAAATNGLAYGRVAEIGLDGSPAIELLEIVAPGTAD
jgi:chorismate-pyruvate lyase